MRRPDGRCETGAPDRRRYRARGTPVRRSRTRASTSRFSSFVDADQAAISSSVRRQPRQRLLCGSMRQTWMQGLTGGRSRSESDIGRHAFRGARGYTAGAPAVSRETCRATPRRPRAAGFDANGSDAEMRGTGGCRRCRERSGRCRGCAPDDRSRRAREAPDAAHRHSQRRAAPRAGRRAAGRPVRVDGHPRRPPRHQHRRADWCAGSPARVRHRRRGGLWR